MAELPLRFIPIGAILGDYEAGESLAIPSVVSPGGSQNLWLDKSSRATSILGYVKRNVAAVTSAAGAQPMRLRHLYHHAVAQGINVSRHELGIFESATLNWELRSSPDRGATWALIQDYGAGFVGKIPSFAQMGTTVILCTGVATPQKVNVLAGTVADAGDIQAAAPTIADTGVGLLQGTKRWRVLALVGGIRTAASRASVRQQFSSRKASVTWAAVGGAESYEIYSTSGTGALFFFEGSVAAPTLTFTSNIADIDLVQNRLLQEHGDPPPNGARWATPHKQRMIYVGSPEFPRRAWVSDAGLPESVNVESNYFEFIDANEQDFSDEAVGASGGYLGMLVVWLEHSVWVLSGPLTINGSILNAERRRTSASVGTVHGRAVARIPAGAAYIDDKAQLITTKEVQLAYLTPFGDVRLFDGEHDTVISHAKSDLLSRLSYESRRKAYCVVDVPRSECTWIFPHDGATECSAAVVWNWESGTMVERPAWTGLAHATQVEARESGSLLLAGESNLALGGYCYQLWEGYSTVDRRDAAFTTAIDARLMLKTLYGSRGRINEDEAMLMSALKRWRWIDFLVKSSGEKVIFTVECWPEEANPDDEPYATQFVQLGTEAIISADGEPLVTNPIVTPDNTPADQPISAVVSTTVLRAKLRQVSAAGKMRYLHSRGVRIRIKAAPSNGSWSIVGANVAYQLLTGMQRVYRRPLTFATIAP